MLELKKRGKERYIDGEQLSKYIQTIHVVEDLDNNGFTIGAVQTEDGKLRGVVYKREGKWYYTNIRLFAINLLILFEPYITIEGKVTKEEFIKRLKAEALNGD